MCVCVSLYSISILILFSLASKLKKKKEEEAYFDEEKSLEAKQRGNEFFGKHQYPDAVKEYEEAIKRNPKDKTLYSNKAAALTKLMAYSEAMKVSFSPYSFPFSLSFSFLFFFRLVFRLVPFPSLFRTVRSALNWTPSLSRVTPGRPPFTS